MIKLKKKLKNKKGEVSVIFLMGLAIAFTILLIFIVDTNIITRKMRKVKISLNEAVKACTASLIFSPETATHSIDVINGEIVFYNILEKNLGLSPEGEPLKNSVVYETPVIEEFEIINKPKNYYSPTFKRNYIYTKPTTVAVLYFRVKGIYLKYGFYAYKLSSAQVIEK